MFKVITALTIAVLLIVGLATPALAFDPVTESSSNTTLYFSNNMTLSALTGTFTISAPNLEGEIEDLTNKVDTIYEGALILVLLFGLAIFGYWGRDRMLVMLAGFIFVGYGGSLWNDSKGMFFILILAGMYFVYKAFADRSYWRRTE